MKPGLYDQSGSFSFSSTAILGIAQILPALAQFILLPVYGWYLGIQEFGYLSLIQASVFIFQVISGNTFATYVSRTWNENTQARDIRSTALIISVLLSFLTASICLALGPQIEAMSGFQTESVLLACCIAGMSTLESIYLSSSIQEKKPSAYLFRISAHILFSSTGSVLGILWLGSTHQAVLTGRAVGMALAILPFTIYAFLRGRLVWKLAGDIFSFVLPLIPYVILSQLLLAGERWTTGFLSGEHAAGYFTLALGLVSLGEMAFQTLRNSVQPEIYSAWAQADSTRFLKAGRYYLRHALLAYSLIFPGAVLTILIFFPETFFPAIGFLPWLQAAFFFRMTFILDSLPEFYSPRKWPLFSAGISGLALSLGAAFILVPRMGILGIAPAVLISRMSMAAIVRISGKSRPQFLQYPFSAQVFLPCILSLTAGIVWIYFPDIPVKWMLLPALLSALGGLWLYRINA